MNDTGTGAGSASTGDLPLDPELQNLFRSATDDVQLRHGADDVLEASRAARQPRSSRRRAAIGAAAVAATVAAVIGVGATQLPSITSTPAGPSATGTDPAGGDPRPRPVSATSPLAFFVTGLGGDQRLVSRARPDLDLRGAIAATIHGEGEATRGRTRWNAHGRYAPSVDIIQRAGVERVDVDLDSADFSGSICDGGGSCPQPAIPFLALDLKLAMQQVAWTARACRGPGTAVRFLLDGTPLSHLDDAVPELVYADPGVFAPLQIDRPRDGELRDGFVLEGYVSGDSPQLMRWAMVRGPVCDVDRRCARSDVGDPFATSPIPSAVVMSGIYPGDPDPVTGRGHFSVTVEFLDSVTAGYHELVVDGGGARSYIPLVVRARDGG